MLHEERSFPTHHCSSSVQELLQPAASPPRPHDHDEKHNRVAHPDHDYSVLWEEVNNEGHYFVHLPITMTVTVISVSIISGLLGGEEWVYYRGCDHNLRSQLNTFTCQLYPHLRGVTRNLRGRIEADHGAEILDWKPHPLFNASYQPASDWTENLLFYLLFFFRQ